MTTPVTLGTTRPAAETDQQSQPVTDRPEVASPKDRAGLRLAAFHATRLYPGPVGELICAELLAVESWGYRIAGTSRAHRLAQHVLAQLDAERQR